MNVRTRGHVLQRHISYVETRWGEEMLESALEHCSNGVANALREALVPGAWFPILWLSRFQHAVVAATGNVEAIEDLSYDTSTGYISQFSGLAAHVLSPSGVLRKVPSMLADSFHGPEVEIEVEGERATVHHTKCVGFDPLLWGMLHAGIVGMLDGTGAHDVRYEILRGGGTSDECLLELQWRRRS